MSAPGHGGKKPATSHTRRREPGQPFRVKHNLLTRYGPVLLVLVLGVDLAVLTYFLLRFAEQERAQADMERRAASYTAAIQHHIDTSVEVVEATGAFLELEPGVTRERFGAFARPFLHRHTELQALEWVPQVNDEERASYEEAARSDGFSGFRFTEHSDDGSLRNAERRAQYYPVYHVEPVPPNQRALGYDLASNEARRQALELARDTGSTVATGPVRLVQETGNQAGFLVFRPVYRTHGTSRSIEERRQNLAGFALGVYRVGDLVEAALRTLPTRDFDIIIEDATAPPDSRLLYWRAGGPGDVALAISAEEGRADRELQSSVAAAGRQWRLRFAPTPYLLQATGSSRPRDSLVLLLMSTVVLAGYTYVRIRHALKVEALADDLSRANAMLQEDIAEKQRLEQQAQEAREHLQLQVRRMPIGVITWGTDFVIQSWNPAAKAIFGFTAEEAVGRHPYELIVPPEARRQVDVVWQKLLEGDSTAHSTNKNVTKDGRTIICQWSNTPLGQSDGKVVGVLSMVQDVTERIRAQEALEQRFAFERVISRVSSRFVGPGDTDAAINQALGNIGALSAADRAYLFLLREDGLTMDNTHEWCAPGVSPQIANLKGLPTDMFPWWMARLRGGEVIHITDVSQLPPEARAEKEVLESQGIKSLLVLPVHVGRELAGFLGFDNVKQTGAWEQDDLTILRVTSQIMGSAIERERAEQHVEARSKRLEAVYKVSQAVASSLDLQRVAEEALKTTLAALGIEAGVIRYMEQETQELVLLGDWGLPEAAARDIRSRPRLRVGQGLSALVVHSEEPLQLENAATDPRTIFKQLWASGFQTFLGVPLRVRHQVVGTLIGFCKQQRVFTTEEVQLAATLGNVVGMAIANARLFEQVQMGYIEWGHTFDAMADGVALVSKDYRIRRANAALARMVGSTSEVLVGQPCYQVMHDLPGPISGCPAAECLAEKHSCHVVRQEPVAGNRWLDFVCNPMMEPQGELQGMVHVIRDVTREREQQEDLGTLYRVSQALSSSLDLDTVLGKALVELVPVLRPTSTMSIVLFDEWQQSGEVRAAQGLSAQAIVGTRIPVAPMQTAMARSLIEKAQVLMVPDTATLDPAVRGIPLLQECGAFAALPLGQPGKVLGALLVADAAGYLPDQRHMELLATSANEITLAVQNAQMFARTDAALRRRVSEMEALTGVLDAASRSLDLESIMRETLPKATQGLDVDRAGITLLDDTGTRATVLASYQKDTKSLVAINVEVDLLKLPSLARLLKEGIPLAIADVQSLPEGHERALAEQWGARSALAVPLVLSGSVMGMLAFTTVRDPRVYSRNDMQLAQAMAGYLATVIQNVRLHERTEGERSVLSSIMVSMGEGLVVVDKDGTVLYCNPSAESILDILAKDVVGKPVPVFEEAWQGRVTDPHELVSAWRSALSHIAERPAVEFALLSGGQRRTVQAVLFSVNALGTGVVLRDVTREREVDQMKTDFISIVSHELRTPMATVYGFAELLAASPELTARHKEWAGMIHSEGRRLTNILDDLLDVSRIEAGRLSLRLSAVAVRPLVARIAEALAPRYAAHDFRMEMPPDSPAVRADEDKLFQVLHNLMDNAAKYSPRGGAITVSTQSDTEKRELIIRIADRGIGIAPGDIPRLFTRFHRIQRSDTEGIRGTGLGLYIVKSLTELMDGRVWVESRLNEGTTFYVALRLVSDEGADL